MRNRLLLLFTLAISQLVAQPTLPSWLPVATHTSLPSPGLDQPTSGYLFTSHIPQLAAQLHYAPSEQIDGQSDVLISLPYPDGSIQEFRVVNAPIMAASLSQKYDLHAYSGYNIARPSHTARISLTAHGLHAVIFTPDGTIFLDPTAPQAQTYLSYWRTAVPTPALPGICGTDEHARVSTHNPSRGTIGSELYVYRLALSATTNYTDFHGGTVADGMAAITIAMTRINGILERDLGIRLELIPNNDLLVFTGTDSFSDNDLFANLGENQQVIDNIIGTANYDVGHVFTRIAPGPGGSFTAGVAIPGGICNTGLKARGASSLPSPTGINFYLVAAHEIGHQFSAGHTWNANSGSCTGGQYSPGTAWEPGSGSTIMGYPGVCGSHNIVNDNDDYFHGGTIGEIFDFSRNGPGSGCAQVIQTGNQPPVISLPADGLILPYATPFVLEGTATDPDGDTLSYCWEQLDLGPPGDPDFPVANAPTFRSFLPRANGVRYFPDIVRYANDQFTIRGEKLPDYSRDLTFRLTVRDNRAGNGAVDWDEVSYSVTDAAGPFVVSSPSEEGVSWSIGRREKVQWDVARTNLPPVNCQQVRILLSTDGGLSYPHVLLEQTPNDGEAEVIVPDLPSQDCRIMVRGADHIFLDISNEDFTIESASQTDVSLYTSSSALTLCAGDTLAIPVSVSPQGGLTGEVRVIVGNVPAGVNALIPVDTVMVGETANLVLVADGNIAGQTTSITFVGISGAGPTDLYSLPISISGSDLMPAEPLLPIAGSTGEGRGPLLSWLGAPGATEYTLEISRVADFSSLEVQAGGIIDTQWQVLQPLQGLTPYYWRVRATDDCGLESLSDVSAFQTGDCRSLSNTDGPFDLPTFGSPNVVESQIQLGAFGTIADLNIRDIRAVHPQVNDLRFRLIGPNGDAVTLLDGICNEGTQHVRIGFDEESALGSPPCPPTDGRLYGSVQPLDVFYGQPTLGTWRMQVTDLEDFDGGTFYGWELEFCTELPGTPDLIRNLPLALPAGSLRTIRDTLLEATDSQFGPSDVTFTLVESPEEGSLQLYGQPLAPGGTFAQRDINLGGLLYQHNGASDGQDQFTFDVRNPNGGWIGLYTFELEVDGSVGISDLAATGYSIYPVPAREMVSVAVPQVPTATPTLQLTDMTGRVYKQLAWPSGKSQMTFSVSDLPPGVYLLTGSDLLATPMKIWVVE